MQIENYVFDNLDKLKSIFNQKAYDKLNDLKNKNSFDGFVNILELILTDDTLEKIKDIKSLIELQNLDENLFKVLKWFAILPLIEIEFNDLVDYFDIKGKRLFKQNLHSLIDKNLLITNGNRYKLYENIKKIILNFFKPNYEECKNLISYFNTKLSKSENINPINRTEYIKFAINILSIFKLDNEKLIELLNNLSIIYREIREYENGLTLQEKTVEVAEKILDKENIHLINSYMIISSLKTLLGNLDEALKYQKKTR